MTRLLIGRDPQADAHLECAAADVVGEELALAAQKLIKEAEAAKLEADAAQEQAEAKARKLACANNEPKACAADEESAKALCQRLGTTRADLRDCVVEFKLDKSDLGIEGARGVAYLFANHMLRARQGPGPSVENDPAPSLSRARSLSHPPSSLSPCATQPGSRCSACPATLSARRA
jgi:hypothetical protein